LAERRRWASGSEARRALKTGEASERTFVDDELVEVGRVEGEGDVAV